MRYEILDKADTLPFSEIEPQFNAFVNQYVYKSRKDRWLALVKKPKQLNKKFGDFWDHLETDRSTPFDITKLPEGAWLYYDGFEELIYKIHTKDLQTVCVDSDGIAFSLTSRLVIFFTHESTEYVFSM